MESENLPLQNPPFTIIEVQRHSQLEEYGSDIVDLSVLVQVDDYQHWVWLTFSEVQEHCEEHFPEIAAYYNSVRTSIKGLGPKHGKMFEVMDEEGFDNLPYIRSAIKMDYDLEQGIKNDQRKGPSKSGIIDKDGTFTPLNEWVEKQDEMGSVVAEMKRTNLRNDAFMDNLLDYLNKEALERFPEIFESEPELIKEFQAMLIHRVRDIGQDMDKLAFKAKHTKE